MADNQLGRSPDVVDVSGEQRRSDRVRFAYRLTVSGTDSSAYPFESGAYTEIITRDGGLLVCSVSLVSRSTIAIARGERKADAKVVAQVGIRGENYLYGFQFLDPEIKDFWDIKFPPFVSSECSCAVLQCSKCSRQELIPLSEVDLMVFEQTRTVPHFCEPCNQETLWQKPELVGDTGVMTGSDSYKAQVATFERRTRNINDRKHPRLSLKNMKACLHRDNFADDEVDVLDMSRGGIRFLSLIDYQPGTLVKVAVPYMKDGANVFLAARIVRVKCRPTIDIPGEFGLRYESR